MATATLELVNPYSKYGFKRRPTYDELSVSSTKMKL